MYRTSDGKAFRGFLDWDPMLRKVNFYYYDFDSQEWTSDGLGKFRPAPVENQVKEQVIGG